MARPRHFDDGSDAAGTCDVYDLRPDGRLDEYKQRLLIDWGRGFISRIQHADKQNKVIVEYRQDFREPDFPGFSHFVAPLSQIERLPSDWIAVLSASQGIYLLTCPRTREQYVGSATGARGFYGRWLDYARNSHGGNIVLKSRDPSDYRVSILEVAGSAMRPDEVIAMEMLWQRKLQSAEMGLNGSGPGARKRT